MITRAVEHSVKIGAERKILARLDFHIGLCGKISLILFVLFLHEALYGVRESKNFVVSADVVIIRTVGIVNRFPRIHQQRLLDNIIAKKSGYGVAVFSPRISAGKMQAKVYYFIGSAVQIRPCRDPVKTGIDERPLLIEIAHGQV